MRRSLIVFALCLTVVSPALAHPGGHRGRGPDRHPAKPPPKAKLVDDREDRQEAAALRQALRRATRSRDLAAVAHIDHAALGLLRAEAHEQHREARRGPRRGRAHKRADRELGKAEVLLSRYQGVSARFDRRALRERARILDRLADMQRAELRDQKRELRRAHRRPHRGGPHAGPRAGYAHHPARR